MTPSQTVAALILLASVIPACESDGLAPPEAPIPAELAIYNDEINWYVEKLDMCDRNVERAYLSTDLYTDAPVIQVSLTEQGGAWLAENSTKHVGRRMDVIVDGDIIMSPIIMEPIIGGSVQVNGGDGINLEEVGRAFLSPCPAQRPAAQ